jgi:diguanylate cyclase
MDRARHARTPLAVAPLDLDHFIRFNDQYGYQAGDQLLKSATAAWHSLQRSSDLLARYGGEEFALLLPTATLGQAVEIVDRLQVATRWPRRSPPWWPWHGAETSDQVIACADQALYRAKEAGRNQVLPAGTPAAPRRLDQDPARKARLAAADRPTT